MSPNSARLLPTRTVLAASAAFFSRPHPTLEVVPIAVQAQVAHPNNVTHEENTVAGPPAKHRSHNATHQLRPTRGGRVRGQHPPNLPQCGKKKQETAEAAGSQHQMLILLFSADLSTDSGGKLT
jgi:hypothetical protein